MLVRSRVLASCITLLGLTLAVSSAPIGQSMQEPGVRSVDPPAGTPPGELREDIDRYVADRSALNRFHAVPMSGARIDRLRRFHGEWRERLEALDFDALSSDGRIDYVLFRNELDAELRLLDRFETNVREMEPLLPFMETIVELEEARRRFDFAEGRSTAGSLFDLRRAVEETRKTLEAAIEEAGDGERPYKAAVGARAMRAVDELREILDRWSTFYFGYDPVFTWWVKEPYTKADEALEEYRAFLRKEVVGLSEEDDDTVVGDPIGREALLGELAAEFIPYSPEELVALAEREFEWCEAEMRRASHELGYGEDWRAALEHIKNLYVEPGRQPQLIRDLALEAIEFVESRGLVTVPELAKQTWRMEMLSPERQRVSPFFLGGEIIQVSYPTDAMAHDEKLMSLRGNNRHFSRATVHHELIPGHHLQQFMTARYRPHRSLFRTPFWTEGWALYWEMLLWDLGFPQSAEDRVGMLFWRMHRSARILFSLGFHLEQMTPDEAIALLVDRVGHERANAEAEVRRSFEGTYGPLYQAAYLLGGLQVRALRRELVDTGRLTDREFHDAILQENAIPIELVRAALLEQPLTRDFRSTWRFYDALR